MQARCKSFNVIHYNIYLFNATITNVIYTLSLHDALPILTRNATVRAKHRYDAEIAIGRAALNATEGQEVYAVEDRKSTRLNSSHMSISYAVFCLKKKKRSRLLLCY